MESEVSIRELKINVQKHIPDSILAGIIALEPDQLSKEDFIAKAGTWISILDSESAIHTIKGFYYGDGKR